MSDYGHCGECGGTGGQHYNDCSYDGCGYENTHTGRRCKDSMSDTIRWILLIGAVIFMGLCPPIGVILMTIVLFA